MMRKSYLNENGWADDRNRPWMHLRRFRFGMVVICLAHAEKPKLIRIEKAQQNKALWVAACERLVPLRILDFWTKATLGPWQLVGRSHPISRAWRRIPPGINNVAF